MTDWDLLILAARSAGAPPPGDARARRAWAALIRRAIAAVEGQSGFGTDAKGAARDFVAALRRQLVQLGGDGGSSHEYGIEPH